MSRIYYTDLPDETYPIIASRTNGLLNGEESIEKIVAGSIEGKNLFDKANAKTLNAYTDSAQNKIISNDSNKVLYIPCNPNTTYTLSKINDNSTFNVAYTTELPANNVSVYGLITTHGTSNNRWYITITTGNDAKYLVSRYIQTTLSNKTNQEVLDSIQIETGSTATDYVPFKKYGYNEDTNMGKVIVEKISGKNLFDKDNAPVKSAYINTSNNQIATSSDGKSTYIKCKPNTTYTISKQAGQAFRWGTTATVPAVGTSVIDTGANHTASSITLTTGATANYLVVYFYNSDNDTVTLQAMIDSIQIEIGEQATSYQNFNETQLGNIIVDDIQNKNKMPLLNNVTYEGITIKSNGDGTYNVSGTATANVECVIFKNLTDTIIQNGEDYTLSFNQATPTGVNSRIEFYNDNTYVRGFVIASNTSTTSTAMANTTGANRARFGLFVTNGTTVNLTNLGIQFEKGKVATSFVLPIKSFDATAYVLWTNPNDTQSFANQLVSLNDALANYKYYEIIYKRSTTMSRYLSTGRIPTNKASDMITNLNYNYIRTISEIWASSFRISDCSYYATYGSTTSTTNNTFIIPYQILGYK